MAPHSRRSLLHPGPGRQGHSGRSEVGGGYVGIPQRLVIWMPVQWHDSSLQTYLSLFKALVIIIKIAYSENVGKCPQSQLTPIVRLMP